MNKIRFFVIINIFLINILCAQVFDSVAFDKKVDSLMNIWKIPGCSIAIVKDSSVFYSKGYGFADIEEKIKAESNTIYGIASCSKAITCFALGLLHEQNKLDWFKPVNNYYPEFILNDPYISANITALDMVTHRSGYAAHDMLWYNNRKTRKELVGLMKYLVPNKSFRSYFQYNNLMYIAAGELIEKISGKTWEEFVKENIFNPLEMNNSSFSINDVKNNKKNSSRYVLNNNKPEKIELLNADNIGGAGSINSTVEDMANWLIMHINKGKFKGKTIISESELQFLQKPVMTVHTPIAYPELFYLSYAPGWYVTAYKGELILRHAGALDGVSTLTSFMPNKKIGVIVIANLDEAANFTTSLTYMIYDLLNGKELTNWSDRFLAELNSKKKGDKKNTDELKQNMTHKLVDYVGVYQNMPYGNVTITQKADGLHFTYNKFAYPLKHITFNTFEIENEYVFGNMRINFGIDVEGNITTISIPFETKTDNIIFTKIK
jgi:CubicO group peptidase (beta-lactamase class C family)